MKPSDDEDGPPPEGAVGPPSQIRDLHPTMDARFVLVEIGKLTNQMENNTKVLERMVIKVENLTSTIKAARTTLVVFGAIMTPLLVAAWWVVTTLWPYRTKLEAIFGGTH